MTVLLQCNGQSETKDQIIGLLGENFPLTAQKLYNLMKKRYLTGASYHAVYKQLKELSAKGVILKQGTEYRLSEEWMERTKLFMDGIENNYAAEKLKGAQIEAIRLLSFKSATDFYNFIEGMRDKFSKENSGKEIYWIGNHAWNPIFYMKSTAEGVKTAIENGIKFYICIKGNTMIDKMAAKFYKDLGVENVVFGTGDENNHVIYIYGNELILVDQPYCVSGGMAVALKRSKKLSEIDLGKLYQNIMQKEQPVQAIIIKNREFVERYKNLIKSYLSN